MQSVSWSCDVQRSLLMRMSGVSMSMDTAEYFSIKSQRMHGSVKAGKAEESGLTDNTGRVQTERLNFMLQLFLRVIC